MTQPLVGLASFAQLLEECEISSVPRGTRGFSYRIFIGLPARRRTCRMQCGRVLVFRRRIMMLHVGTFRSTEPIWSVHRKLDSMFPLTAWRVSPL